MEKTEKKTVTITAPRGNNKNDDSMMIGINGKNYILPRDEPVEVPPEVAEEFERAQRAERAFYKEAKKRADATARKSGLQ